MDRGRLLKKEVMLTIIRVTAGRRKDLPDLEKIGLDMNRVKPGVYTGLRRRGDGFACDLSSSSDWQAHERSALDFVALFSSHLQTLRNLGARVTVDMAIDLSDLKKPIECVHFGGELLRALGDREIALEVTIYTGQPFGADASSFPEPEGT
jgi:hypothetical protein